MKRRGFLGILGASGATAAAVAANPVGAAAKGFFSPVPKEVVDQVIDEDGIAHFQMQLIIINERGRPEAAKWMVNQYHPKSREEFDGVDPLKVKQVNEACKPLLLRGNVERPGAGAILQGDPVSFDAPHACTVKGVRVFGGQVAGRPWNAFADFAASPSLCAGNVLTVNYTLSIGDGDSMSPENIDKPLRDLI